MPRLKSLNNSQANPTAKELLVAVEKKLGKAPNIFRTMANSTAVLEGYLGFSGALAKGALNAKLREQIALVVGESNSCEYCLAAHSALGRGAGLSAAEIADSRRAVSSDQRSQAALQFARKLVVERGRVVDADVDALRKTGFDDGDIAEIVANVALNVFTNYFNHVAGTDIDFPKADAPQCNAASVTVS